MCAWAVVSLCLKIAAQALVFCSVKHVVAAALAAAGPRGQSSSEHQTSSC